MAFSSAAHAQAPALPVVGVLSLGAPGERSTADIAFREGLKEIGFEEGHNVAFEYRWAAGRNDLFRDLAADLVARRVQVIVAAGGNRSALAAKEASSQIPIVFQMGADPVALGLVGNLDRPGGNLTGVTSMNVEAGPQRVRLLHGVVPKARILALLTNPDNAASETLAADAREVAQTLGLELRELRASSEHDLDLVFEELLQLRAGGLVIGNDPFFSLQSKQLADLALTHAVPSIATRREFAAAGGLMSYGGSLKEVFRLAGIYTGRILKGEKPAVMPVYKSTKLELVLNLNTARLLGIEFPGELISSADERIG